MTITLKAKEVKGIIDDKPSLLICANAVLEQAKELIVEKIKPIRVDVLFENGDYVNDTVTIYIVCEIGEEGWIMEEMLEQPRQKEI
jgi:hypothetical protein